MQTITDKLQILKDNTESIRQALSDKVGYDVGPMLKDYSEIISSITGGGILGESDVNFYDYDGTLLHSYSKDEFLVLSSLPEFPSRDGLICQGWNYTFEDAIEYIQEYGKLDIGTTYITDDNKTRLYINLLNDGMSIPLYIDQSVENSVIVDWGDGSSETISGTGAVIFNHTYNKAGSYIISLIVNSGTCTLGHNSYNYNVMGATNTIASGSLYKVEIGSDVSIGDSAFTYCYNLQSITIPDSVTEIGGYAFYDCYSLQSINIPNSVTDIGYECTFPGCHNLQSITIPNSVTEIGYGAFGSCYNLQSITIPNSVIVIGEEAFYYCYGMQYYDFTSHASIPTISNTNAFNGISYGCEIRVPAALYEDWINATNWNNYYEFIVPYDENGQKVQTGSARPA